MNVFELRNRLIADYGGYVRGFIEVRNGRINELIEHEFAQGLLWPDPLIQVNPSFEHGGTIEDLVREGVLHDECSRIFRMKRPSDSDSRPLRLHCHQANAVRIARAGHNYVLTTGTGSGKSLTYMIPIVDHVLRHGSGLGITAIVVYPMNALANSQLNELQKFLSFGYPDGRGPVTFARYTGQEREPEREQIIAHPPDILLTNYVMLELLLTRPKERALVQAARGLKFLVLDELHTYRGRQGADVALLVRRARDAFASDSLQCVGTSATLAGAGTFEEQRAEIARVASLLFGSRVDPSHIIGETFRRTTHSRDFGDPAFVEELRRRVETPEPPLSRNFAEFANDPLSIWIESTLGLTRDEATGRLMRATPRSITGDDGAARQLSLATGIDASQCAHGIERHLLASYACEPNPETGFPMFAFRLHQFISRGDTVYASLEPEDSRFLTVCGQQFVPGDRARLLFPLAFCRECGQEYYCVRSIRSREGGPRSFSARTLSDRMAVEEGEPGYLYISASNPWPSDAAEVAGHLPDDWLELKAGIARVRRSRQPDLPRNQRLSPAGSEDESGVETAYLPAPFRFCLSCGVAYSFRQTSEFAKLSSLATEGRSTATTVMSLAAVRYLRDKKDLPEHARKLLSFTDNRQDASLQAGHFNDFVEIGLLRSALYRAVAAAGPSGLAHDVLVQRVFESLGLPTRLYAVDHTVRFQALDETNRAFRSMLGYRLYHDQRRGWRITSPNLEQCGLLEIRYLSLDDLCQAGDVWEHMHPALAQATPDARRWATATLLDFVRRELAIKVDYLDPLHQERILQQSSQRLIPPWAIDENERLERAVVAYPRASRETDPPYSAWISPRGGFGQLLRRPATFPHIRGGLSTPDTEVVIRQLFEALRVAGLVEQVRAATDRDPVAGYQLPASAMVWVAGDGSRPAHDPIRMPRGSATGGRTNPFFVDYYRGIAADGAGIEAREHTAQVRYEDRQDREDRFKKGQLPVLFCSPTMELGVDIAELNVVNMRNIPPTPANYAQRSGRAGRSGQPAFVFSYCSTFSNHDQYFFRRPMLMVSGSVVTPRLDLANEDLIRAHVQAIWLAEAGISLGTSLRDVLDLSGENPSLELLPSVRDALNEPRARDRARARSRKVLNTLQPELAASDWYSDGWIDEVLAQIPQDFDRTCERWRGLYRAASRQRAVQHRIISDATRSPEEKARAKMLRAEAESQIDLLAEAQSVIEADFYSYRYFASEGFLPGYSFPRLPLSAYIPGRRERGGRNEFISRPRFLAITEFGPRAIVYHEGARYHINKVILPARGESDDLVTSSVKQCETCGYLHPISDGAGPDLCERCSAALGVPLSSLFRLQNVSTRRADRISSDEEERIQMGYEIRTGIRFASPGGRPSSRSATVTVDGAEVADLRYAHAATLWRVNLGWKRRAHAEQHGFVLDTERGFWARNPQDTRDDADDPLSRRTQRVIPYVEDRRNSLLVEPCEELDEAAMASLQAALKNALQIEYQLEDAELAAEPLPSRGSRRLLLFYEAAEGGAGVLRRLLDDPTALQRVARQALAICHFDPATGDDLRRAPRAREDCEAACYDCLMSYTNQADHKLLDRASIRDLLFRLCRARVDASPVPASRPDHLAALMRQCESDLERKWLDYLEERDLRLPSRAQSLVEACGTRPDFLYEDSVTAIYIDGPHHLYPEREARDRSQTASMEDRGYTVVRFSQTDDWDGIVASHPNVFGRSE